MAVASLADVVVEVVSIASDDFQRKLGRAGVAQGQGNWIGRQRTRARFTGLDNALLRFLPLADWGHVDEGNPYFASGQAGCQKGAVGLDRRGDHLATGRQKHDLQSLHVRRLSVELYGSLYGGWRR